MKKHNNSPKKSEPTSKRAKSRGQVQPDPKEVLAKLLGKLREKLDSRAVATSAEEEHARGYVLLIPAERRINTGGTPYR